MSKGKKRNKGRKEKRASKRKTVYTHEITKNGKAIQESLIKNKAFVSSFLRSKFKSNLPMGYTVEIRSSNRFCTSTILSFTYQVSNSYNKVKKVINKLILGKKNIGFTSTSGKKLNKEELRNTNSSYNEKLDGKSYILNDSKTGKAILVHLRNVLSPVAWEGFHTLKYLHCLVPPSENIECKGFGSGANGIADKDQIIHSLRKEKVRNSLGIQYVKKIRGIVITGTSAKVEYVNKNREIKKFQIANPMNRSIFKLGTKGWSLEGLRLLWQSKMTKEGNSPTEIVEHWKTVNSNIDKYREEIELISEKYLHLFGESLNIEEFLHGSGLHLCTNIVSVSGRGQTRIAFHEDSFSAGYPSVMTCNNSTEKMMTSGELVIASIGFVCNYGPKDVVLVDGTHMHGVLPLDPGQGNGGMTRTSSVLYYNPPK